MKPEQVTGFQAFASLVDRARWVRTVSHTGAKLVILVQTPTVMSPNAQKARVLRCSLIHAQFVFTMETPPPFYDVGFAASLAKQE